MRLIDMGMRRREAGLMATGWLRVKGVALRLEFKPEDLWVGAFWKRSGVAPYQPAAVTWVGQGMTMAPGSVVAGWDTVDLWVCLVPMMPLHARWGHARRDGGRR